MLKFSKKTTLVFLTWIIFVVTIGICSVLTVNTKVYAADNSNLTFSTLSDGTLSVRRRDSNLPSGELEIPEKYEGRVVSTIGDGAFVDCKLTRVTLPSTITTISEQAFRGISTLVDINIPNSVKTIGARAFMGCSSLRNLALPDSITSIGETAFAGIGNPTIRWPESVTKIPEGCFVGSSSLTTIYIPTSVSLIYAPFTNSALNHIYYHGTRTQWDRITLRTYPGNNPPAPIPDGVIITCLGDEPCEVTASHSNSAITSYTEVDGDVLVNFYGHEVSGYYSMSRDSYPSSSDTSFTLNKTFSTEGYYRIEARNIYTSPTVFYFRIDKTAPIGLLSGVSDGGYTNGNVSFSWSESGLNATLNGSSYSSGSTVYTEGTYKIVLTDKAGNFSEYSFTIDKTAPKGSLSGVSNGGYTNGNVSFSWSESSATATRNGYSYSSGRSISAEGKHNIVLTDIAGNSTSYSFTIDKSAPVIESYKEYTNTAFTLTAQDTYCAVKAWEFTLDGGAVKRVDGQSITLGGGSSSNGIWQVRVFDELDNGSQWITVNFAYRDKFGNADSIYNSYSVPSYFTATFSQKNYAACYGTYSFADYDSALEFAVAKEWECRVIVLDGGASWNYVTTSNENARQIYTDVEELDAAIDMYARRNISARKVLGKNGTVLSNPTDAYGVTRPDALAKQIAQLPQVLSDYASYRFMLAPADYTLKSPQRIVDGNKITVTAQFISDGISLRVGQEIELEYGRNLGKVLSVNGEQGWFLITERDVCGNVEQYLIYLDIQQPELRAEVTYGDGTDEIINFNQTYVDDNSDAMRFISFDIATLADNIDDYVMLSIEGRNLSAQYVWGDELPVLSFENGYHGAYTVTAYDRSHNVIEFEIYIAGENPTLTHTSLTSDISCKFVIQINDSHNAMTDVKLFKVFYDGSEERLYVDSANTPVNASSLEYRMTVGGKYLFEFTDLFKRTVRTEAIFYMKGLPTATLKGVKEGGLTKNDVSVIYDVDVTAELFIFKDGEWESTDKCTNVQGVKNNTLEIIAGEDTTAVYKVLLYVTSDKNLFSEYTFEIDGIPPKVDIRTYSDDVVNPESVTTENFYVTWQESGYKGYYKRQGGLTESQYTKGAVISTAGTYVFTFYDAARNELSFTVTLDNYVSYSLSGTYTLLEDGSYISRSGYVFSLNEPWDTFDVDASNGLSVVNGQKLDVDGTYVINAMDMYGNALTLTLIVDKLPPVPIIIAAGGSALTPGAHTAEAFRLYCEEANVTITYSYAGAGFVAYDGSTLDVVGLHAFKLTDRGGNVANVTIAIDRNVEYSLEGTYVLYNGAYQFRLWARVVPGEDVNVFTIENEQGVLFDPSGRLSEEGIYNVTIEDTAANRVVFKVIIDKTAAEVSVVTESGISLTPGSTTNEAFRIESHEENITVTYTLNNTSSGTYEGGWLNDVGVYNFKVSDFLGNAKEFTIIINRTVSITVNGNYVVNDLGEYISRSWFSVTQKEQMETFYLEAEDGTRFEADVRVTAEGIYRLYAKDMFGNELVLHLIIDATPPTVELDGVSADCATKSAVNVHFFDYSEAYVQFSGSNQMPVENNVSFNEEGDYVLTARDFAGNVTKVEFSIDKHVAAEPSIALADGQIITDSVSFEFGETVTARLRFNGLESTYTRGKLSEPGVYVLRVTDAVGNFRLFNWRILPAKARAYTIELNEGAVVTVMLNDSVIVLPRIENTIALSEAGNYTLSIDSGDSEWTVALEVDNVAPEVKFENMIRKIRILEPNKDGISYELFRDGSPVSFNLTANHAAELTAKGDYRLICTDDVGNVTEYVFKLHYLGDFTIALIIILCVLVVVAIVALLIVRFRRNKY